MQKNTPLLTVAPELQALYHAIDHQLDVLREKNSISPIEVLAVKPLVSAYNKIERRQYKPGMVKLLLKPEELVALHLMIPSSNDLQLNTMRMKIQYRLQSLGLALG